MTPATVIGALGAPDGAANSDLVWAGLGAGREARHNPNSIATTLDRLRIWGLLRQGIQHRETDREGGRDDAWHPG